MLKSIGGTKFHTPPAQTLRYVKSAIFDQYHCVSQTVNIRTQVQWRPNWKLYHVCDHFPGPWV